MGMPFPEAFSDHKWTDWFVSQYEKSTKEAHQKFIMYAVGPGNQGRQERQAAALVEEEGRVRDVMESCEGGIGGGEREGRPR